MGLAEGGKMPRVSAISSPPMPSASQPPTAAIPPSPGPSVKAKWAAGGLLWVLIVGGGAFTYWQTQIRPAFRAAAIADAHWRADHGGEPLIDNGFLEDPDGAHFVYHTWEQGRHGNSAWRVRRTDADGPTGGREMRWAMLNIWWLRLLGELRNSVTAEGPDPAIRAASAWSGPVLLLLGLAAWSGGLALTRNGRGWAAGALALATLLVLGAATYKDFGFGFPDHHGWHQWAALGLALGLAVRWLGPRGGSAKSLETAWGWRVLGPWGQISAGAGAAILWLGASQALVIFVALCASAGCAMLLGKFFYRPEPEETEPTPALVPEFWRWWGLVGAAWALGFYLLENAPNYFSMRLEVNHPLYIVLWAALGEALCRWSRILEGPEKWGSRRDWTALILCGLPVAAVAVTFYLAPEQWLFSKHPGVVRTIGLINEASPGIDGLKGLLHLPNTYRYTAVVWAAAGWALIPRWGRLSPRAWMTMATLLCLSAILVLGSALQERWLGQATAVTAALAACVVAALPGDIAGPKRGRSRYWIAAVIVLGQFALYAVSQATTAFAAAPPGAKLPPDTSMQAARLMAYNELIEIFRRERPEGAPRAVVVTTPLMPMMTATFLYAPVRPFGTFYWENFPSLWKSVDLLAEEDEGVALEEMRRLGITHLALSTMPEAMTSIFMMQYGDPKPHPRALAMRLANPLHSTPPPWLVPVDGTDSYFMKSARLKIYRFVPPPAPAPVPQP